MPSNPKANPILINGYGTIRSVQEAKRVAETAKQSGVTGMRALDTTVVLNEALLEAEFIILQFVEKARQYDLLMVQLQKKQSKKGKK